MRVKFWKISGLILIMIFALSTLSMVHAAGVIATIPVGNPGTSSPYDYYPAYDPSRGEVYVTNEGVATVSVISDSSNSVLATVPMRFSPTTIAYDSGKGEMFVANGGPSTTLGTISVISDDTNTVVANVTVGTTPVGVAYDSNKGEIFVANSGD
jgi:YVTN family beta-propeller protein